MRETLAAADWNGLERAAHRLKGASANLDARAISELAGRLESMSRERKPEEIPTILDQLNVELERFQTEMEAFLKEAA